jgi:HSP20 family molecular chaperone IbpA
MSVFFPRFNEFSPLFRLADELDRAARQSQQTQVRTFSPKFDVKETKGTYELNGELPGIDQSNVNIEWSDEHTLSISGRTESRFESSNEEKAAQAEPEVTETEVEDSGSETYQKPSVEDEGAEKTTSSTETPAETAVTQTEPKTVTKQCSPKSRYWVAERSIGSFHRTFHFPGRVDHDAVKANLKNGVLNIVVPKAKALEPKKISIN